MAEIQQGEPSHGRMAAAAQRGLSNAQTTPWLRCRGDHGVAHPWRVGGAGTLPAAHRPGRRGRHPAGGRRRPGGPAGAAHRPPRAVAGAALAGRDAGAHREPGDRRRGRRGHRRRAGQPERRASGQLDNSLQQADTAATGASEGTSEPPALAQGVVSLLLHGVLGSLFSSASGLVVGCVLGLFMLLFLLKDWSQITGWTTRHVGLPAPVGRSILDDTVLAFRGYAIGLTIIGAANAAVVFVGALLLGVPLAATIALVSFVTSYVPYIGAFVAGAFATLIAYGRRPGRRPGHAGDRPACEQHHPKRRRAVRVRHPAAATPPRRAAHGDHCNDAVRCHGRGPGRPLMSGVRRIRAVAQRGRPRRHPAASGGRRAGRCRPPARPPSPGPLPQDRAAPEVVETP